MFLPSQQQSGIVLLEEAKIKSSNQKLKFTVITSRKAGERRLCFQQSICSSASLPEKNHQLLMNRRTEFRLEL